MSSTVAKRIAVSMPLAFACGWTNASLAAKAESAAGVVARLYKDFAREAMTSQPKLFGEGLAHQDKATLRRYFTPTLAELLARDAACQADIRPQSLDLVEVAFKDPVSGERTRIAFRLARVDGKWRVADILYRQQGTSLKNVLSRRMPR